MNTTTTNKPTATSGISILGILGVAFIILKLTGIIAWSWWFVLAPFWVPAVLAIVFLAIVGLVILALHIRDRRRAKRNLVRK